MSWFLSAIGLAAVVMTAFGCNQEAAAETVQLVINGQARSFLLERPPDQTQRPTLIMLHGSNGSGAVIARRSGLDRLGPKNGYAAVFPDGLRNRWNHFLPGKEPPLFIENTRELGGVPDDVEFLRMLVADLVGRGISDPKRIYLAGYSNGSFMALRMICADAGLFAAAALLASGMPDGLGADCHPARPIAVLMINGTADRIVPYAGGAAQPGGAFKMWPTERLIKFFRQLNGCTGTAALSPFASTARNKVEVARSAGCAGAPVVSYRVIDGDHSTPWDLKVGPLLLDFFDDKTR
jgi:polyhydroxybutyrate depolymerase